MLDPIEPEGTFVPNDTLLGGEAGKMLLITGPNMAGKSPTSGKWPSCYHGPDRIFCSGAPSHLGIIDQVFSRIGASDDLSRGQSPSWSK